MNFDKESSYPEQNELEKQKIQNEESYTCKIRATKKNKIKW